MSVFASKAAIVELNKLEMVKLGQGDYQLLSQLFRKHGKR